MAKRIRTYFECDGCHRTELDGIEIVRSSKSKLFNDEADIHFCADCDDAGKYYCRHCRRVHNDENLCHAARQLLAEADLPF